MESELNGETSTLNNKSNDTNVVDSSIPIVSVSVPVSVPVSSILDVVLPTKTTDYKQMLQDAIKRRDESGIGVNELPTPLLEDVTAESIENFIAKLNERVQAHEHFTEAMKLTEENNIGVGLIARPNKDTSSIDEIASFSNAVKKMLEGRVLWDIAIKKANDAVNEGIPTNQIPKPNQESPIEDIEAYSQKIDDLILDARPWDQLIQRAVELHFYGKKPNKGVPKDELDAFEAELDQISLDASDAAAAAIESEEEAQWLKEQAIREIHEDIEAAAEALQFASGLFQGAISQGVPLFNNGDYEGCRQIYMSAVATVVDDDESSLQCIDEFLVQRVALSKAFAEAATATPNSGAWIMRHAIDDFLLFARLFHDKSVIDGASSLSDAINKCCEAVVKKKEIQAAQKAAQAAIEESQRRDRLVLQHKEQIEHLKQKHQQQFITMKTHWNEVLQEAALRQRLLGQQGHWSTSQTQEWQWAQQQFMDAQQAEQQLARVQQEELQHLSARHALELGQAK